MAWNKRRQIALAVVPKVSAVLSLSGSLWIIVEILWDKNKRCNVYHRLLACMAVYDVLESIWNFGSTWPIPRGTEGIWGAAGNVATCEAQGFFLQLGLTIPVYNAALSIYYMLVIRYGMAEERLRTSVEPVFHAVALLLGGGTASAAAVLDLYNNANLWCWIAPYPAGCLDSIRYGDELPCERGDNAWAYRWGFYFGWLWSCVFCSIVTMLLVYLSVRNREAATQVYRNPSMSFSHHSKCTAGAIGFVASGYKKSSGGDVSGGSSVGKENDGDDQSIGNLSLGSNASSMISRAELARQEASEKLSRVLKRIVKRQSENPTSNPRSKEVFAQAMWFMAAFWMTHFFSTVNRILQQVIGQTYYPLILLHSLFDPLQGFLNFLVYRRPRYMRHRHRNPDLSRRSALMRTLRWSFLGPPKTKLIEEELPHEEPYEDKVDDATPSTEAHSRPAAMSTIIEASVEDSIKRPRFDSTTSNYSLSHRKSTHSSLQSSARHRSSGRSSASSFFGARDDTTLQSFVRGASLQSFYQRGRDYDVGMPVLDLKDDAYEDATLGSEFVTFDQFSSYSQYESKEIIASDDEQEKAQNETANVESDDPRQMHSESNLQVEVNIDEGDELKGERFAEKEQDSSTKSIDEEKYDLDGSHSESEHDSKTSADDNNSTERGMQKGKSKDPVPDPEPESFEDTDGGTSSPNRLFTTASMGLNDQTPNREDESTQDPQASQS